MIRTSTRIVATEPIAIAMRLSGTDAGMLTPDFSQDDQEDRREPEEQNGLPDRARMPADDRHGRAVALARVPARERRHREQQPEHERQAATEAGDIAAAGKPATPQS